jgi:hypothetical protein
MPPGYFRSLSWEDQAEMIAHDRDIEKMTKHEQEESEREMKAKDLGNKMKSRRHR